jgi:ankyrin repeat protein
VAPTPAHRLIAAAFESPDALQTLIRSEPELIEERTGLGETALHYLAVENQLRAVVLLAEAGAQINTLNSCGGTPLSEAASLGYVELVEFLLLKGASLHMPGQSEPTLHEATRNGNAAVVRLLLGAGAPIDEQNDLRETPLHLAAESDDRVAVLELLLNSGANSSLTRIFDETPLDVALDKGNSACISALVAAGARRGGSDAT